MKKLFIALFIFLVTDAIAQNCTTCGGRGYLVQNTPCRSCQYGYVQSTTTRDCSRCYGRGSVSVTCNKCSGNRTKYEKRNYRCTQCKGSGYEKTKVDKGQCRTCLGTGNIERNIGYRGTSCTTCGGEGKLYEIREINCRNCVKGIVSRVEQVPCSQCNGSGSVGEVCPQCNGRRKLTEQTTTPCSVCRGTGNKEVRNTCTFCRGTGRR